MRPNAELKKRKRPTALIVTGILVLLCVVCGIFGTLSKPKPEGQATATAQTVAPATEVAKPTNTPVPTKTPVPPTATLPLALNQTPTPTLAPGDMLVKVAQEQFGNGFRRAEIATVGEARYATVDYVLGPVWDEGHAVRVATRDFVRFAPKVFAISAVDVLELRTFSKFKDIYGYEKDEVAFKFTITRQVAEKVNWSGVELENVGLILTAKGCGVYVHQALKSAWNEYQR